MKLLPATGGKDWKYAEDARYDEVTEELKRSLQQQQFKAGQLLTQVSEEELFGHWGNFRDFVQGELKIAETHAYRLMFAYQCWLLLELSGCPLPINERQVRPLKLLKEDKLRVTAWKRACKMKQASTPTHKDVLREVRRLLDPKANETTDTTYRAYRQHFESIKVELARATEILADGDLEEFLLCTDQKASARNACWHSSSSSSGLSWATTSNDSRSFSTVSCELQTNRTRSRGRAGRYGRARRANPLVG